MSRFATALIVVSFCVGTVGAAAMDRPAGTWGPLLGGGLAGVVVGGLLERRLRRGAGRDDDARHARTEAVRKAIERIIAAVVALDDARDTMPPEEAQLQIDSVLANEFFDLTAQHEEIAATFGFARYAAVWDGVATAERVLARAWSLITDGHASEGLEHLPRVRACLERSLDALGPAPAAAEGSANGSP